MKKRAVSVILAMFLALSLCACGGSGAQGGSSGGQNGGSEGQDSASVTEGQNSDADTKENGTQSSVAYTIDDLLGKWHSAETEEIITVKPAGATIFFYEGPSSSVTSLYTTIEGNTVEFSGIGKFSIEEGKLTCLETNRVAKDTVFVKVEENLCSLEDLYGEWTGLDGSKTLEINDQSVLYDSGAGKHTIPLSMCELVDNVLYASNIDKFEIIKEGDTYRLIGSTEYVPKGSEAAAESSQSKYLTIDGIYLDESYEDKDSESIKLLYLFYTAATDDQNLKLDSKSAVLTIGSNTYQSEHIPHACRYMPSYYYSDYLKDVYVGESVLFVETFKVPVGALSSGNTMTLAKSQVTDATAVQLSTDDIVFCEDVEEIAEKADPEGYEEELDRLSPADDQTVRDVKNGINGYSWDFYVNSITYQIEFWDSNNFELRVPKLGIENGGTYEVLNGYVRCNYDDTDNMVEIPWEWKDGDIDLNVTDAFDVRKN